MKKRKKVVFHLTAAAGIGIACASWQPRCELVGWRKPAGGIPALHGTGPPHSSILLQREPFSSMDRTKPSLPAHSQPQRHTLVSLSHFPNSFTMHHPFDTPTPHQPPSLLPPLAFHLSPSVSPLKFIHQRMFSRPGTSVTCSRPPFVCEGRCCGVSTVITHTLSSCRCPRVSANGNSPLDRNPRHPLLRATLPPLRALNDSHFLSHGNRYRCANHNIVPTLHAATLQEQFVEGVYNEVGACLLLSVLLVESILPRPPLLNQTALRLGSAPASMI